MNLSSITAGFDGSVLFIVLACFIVGLTLLAVEVLVVPGVGVPGIVGGGLIMFAIVYALWAGGAVLGLLTLGVLLTGCGSKEASETPAAATPSETGAEKDQEPIFQSDFEEGNTDEWTSTQESEADTDASEN